ncbi:MAG: glycosyltransferase family 2 protein [Bryobacterales bacterium]|nr:glycosyltransferase family 2 protein [Bryobacterales bacterium]
MSLDASVIVPTFNRRELLMELLASLGRQSLARDRFEVLVMDNGSSDGTAREVARFAAGNPGLQLKFHVMEVNRGPVVSRNRGAELAAGGVLCFTDSDVVVPEDWLERGLAAFHRTPELAMLSGPTVDKPDQRHTFFSVGAGNSYAENPIYPTSNVMYRKCVFEEVGGFDAEATRGDLMGVAFECNDVDLAWKVIGKGFRKEFLPEMAVFHEVRQEPLNRWFAVQMRVFYLPAMVRRHPGIRSSILWFGPFVAPENLLYYIAVASLALSWALRSPWWLLGLAPMCLWFLPFLRRNWPPLRWPKLAAQLGMILVRQTLICGALLCGSVRSRQMVL